MTARGGGKPYAGPVDNGHRGIRAGIHGHTHRAQVPGGAERAFRLAPTLLRLVRRVQRIAQYVETGKPGGVGCRQRLQRADEQQQHGQGGKKPPVPPKRGKPAWLSARLAHAQRITRPPP